MESIANVPKTISSMPDEVLIEIFQYLSAKKNRNQEQSDLLNATLVCKKWNQIISGTSSLMDKVKFKMFKDKNEAANEQFLGFRSTRNYKHVELDGWTFHSGDALVKISLQIVNCIVSSFGNHLKTMNLNWIQINSEVMKVLSSCKLLQSLNFWYCSVDDAEPVKATEFKSLRILKLSGDSSTAILNMIKCEELDDLFLSSTKTNMIHVVAFLNQLDRCDSLHVISFSWKFDVMLKPKFVWKKLEIEFKNSNSHDAENYENEIASITALCKASAPNSEAIIAFVQDINFFKIWNAVITNCKCIKQLTVNQTHFPTIPTYGVQLQNIKSIKLLIINPESLQKESFVNFANNLPNVTSLQLFGRFVGINLSAETQELLEPFFDQILELTLPEFYMDDPASSNNIHHLRFKNLKKLNTYLHHFEMSKRDQRAMLKHFCLRHQSLNHLNVRAYGACPGMSLITLFGLRSETAVTTCNILTHNENREYQNWRKHQAGNEIKIFGKVLTEDENRFFV